MYWMQYSNPANPNWFVVDNATVTRLGQSHHSRYESYTHDKSYTDDAMNSNTHPFWEVP